MVSLCGKRKAKEGAMDALRRIFVFYATLELTGDGRWTTLAKAAGLQRCGKSCRLRWVNYLRPGIKRGNITAEEERVIIDLHSRWGNRWSLIAERIPGRTDNEIKNYWRSHLKKKLQNSGDQNSDVSQVQAKQVSLPPQQSFEVFIGEAIEPYQYNYSTETMKTDIDNVQSCTQTSFSSSSQVEACFENEIGMSIAGQSANANELSPMLYSFPSGIPIESDATAIFDASPYNPANGSELYGADGCDSDTGADIMLWNMCPIPIPNMEMDTPFVSATPFRSFNAI
ncbi:hypothetical protein KI387_002187 [Taxus chinensis]|uniref:Uncharacterized protein n=1 Tax=Taxus chinensis TaxID=29808 RepID=A0AA38LNB7_TAXCH|nr:hypothetical protein KI387_002187 [Taxus chinensis]